MDALPDHPSLRYVLGLQEGVVVGMADGFARASGGLAACNVHVAPGLGNAMGSLYNAHWIGSPVIVTAGQQEQGHGLTEPVLYGPMLEMARPLAKWVVEVTRVVDLPRIVRRAAKIALAPPTGPVFISLPGDILNDQAAMSLGRQTRVDASVRPNDEALERLARRLLEAERPALLCGHEVAECDALDAVARLAELIGAPAFQQTVAQGAHFLSEHRAFMGSLGREQPKVREVLGHYDLLVCLGCDLLRMSVASPVDPLPEDLPVVQIGQRDWEMGKNYPTEMALRAHLGETLAALLPKLEAMRSGERAAQAERALQGVQGANWSTGRDRLKAEASEVAAVSPIDPRFLMRCIVERLPENATVVDEGLVTSRPLLGMLPFRDRHDLYGLASGGIGFALPGAIGIALALPERRVVAIVGDGSAMYSIQALWTAAHLKLPMTYIIANNRGYRILKERLVAFHGNQRFIGMDLREPAIDFVGLATSMGVTARHVAEPDDLAGALDAGFAEQGPVLLDVAVADGFGG